MEAQPYFRPLLGHPPGYSQHDALEASRIASEETMAHDRALYGVPRRAKPQLPLIKQPVLSQDFAQRVAQLDEKILARGVAVERAKLVELGKTRFEQLVVLDQKFSRNALGAGVDLSSFKSVQNALFAFQAPSVPARKLSEQASGSGKERDAVRLIQSFDDLWKFTSERGETLREIFEWREKFESLVFAQSLLERVEKDGHVRSRFFCGGRGRRVELLRDWQQVLLGSLTSVKLVEPLWHVVSWLAGEKTPAPSPVDLARTFNGVRAPSLAQIKLAQAVLDAFLLDHRDWSLWQYVGRETRCATDQTRLAGWRKDLATQFRRVSMFHDAVREYFWRDANSGDLRSAHLQFDSQAHTLFLERTIEQLLDTAGALLTLGIEETFSGAVVARFQDAVLVEGKRKLADKRTSIARQLAAAFPASAFELQFEEQRP